MKIAFIGKFAKLHDEEYIARSFESIGCQVFRISEAMPIDTIFNDIMDVRPDYVLYTKFSSKGDIQQFLNQLRAFNIKSICWVFDLYFNYTREFRLRFPPFKADFVFSTDGGNQERFKELGINHKCVRQGIYKPECFMEDNERKGIVFVGTENPIFPERTEVMKKISKLYPFRWIGRRDPNECRGIELNELYSTSEIVIGDSFYSPFYWSNRIVETLGRGGFLIHQEVEGLKDEYPYLVTYKRGDFNDLMNKIDYYLEHIKEREELRRKNFEWVRDNYTCDKKCKQLLDYVKTSR